MPNSCSMELATQVVTNRRQLSPSGSAAARSEFGSGFAWETLTTPSKPDLEDTVIQARPEGTPTTVPIKS